MIWQRNSSAIVRTPLANSLDLQILNSGIGTFPVSHQLTRNELRRRFQVHFTFTDVKRRFEAFTISNGSRTVDSYKNRALD